MEIISQRQMRNDSARILRRVAAGESFVITNAGVEVARLVPFAPRHSAERDELVSRGVLAARRLGDVELPTPVASRIDLGLALDVDRSER
jgi:prevent-host-death family protein